MNLTFTVITRYQVDLEAGDDFDAACKMIHANLPEVIAKAKKIDDEVDSITEHGRQQSQRSPGFIP